MLSKTGGTFAPKTKCGPHDLKSSIPLCLLLKRLNLANTKKEIKIICRENLIKINNKTRTDKNFPVGLFDVLTITKTNEHYRLLYNINKKFYLHRITSEEARYRLVKIRGKKEYENVPYIYSKDGVTFKYEDPSIEVGDTLKINMDNEVIEHVRYEEGKLTIVISGRNLGCIGVVMKFEKSEKTDDMVYLKDLNGRMFATKAKNCFVIGQADKPLITLPQGNGIKLSEYDMSIQQHGEMKAEENTEDLE